MEIWPGEKSNYRQILVKRRNILPFYLSFKYICYEKRGTQYVTITGFNDMFLDKWGIDQKMVIEV